MDLLNSVIGSIDEDMQQVLLQWPPFFTIQPHAEIRSKQLRYWSEILFLHFKKTKTQERKFCQINPLNSEEIMMILEEMEAQGKISWRKEGDRSAFFVNKYSCYELADAIYAWAKNKGKVGSIETLKWISEGEDTDSHEKFAGMREEMLLKSVRVLENDGRAQVFTLDKGKFGVKFK